MLKASIYYAHSIGLLLLVKASSILQSFDMSQQRGTHCLLLVRRRDWQLAREKPELKTHNHKKKRERERTSLFSSRFCFASWLASFFPSKLHCTRPWQANIVFILNNYV